MPQRGGAALSYVGKPVPRVEDDALLRGAAPFVADLRVEGCLEAVFARSRVAHGSLREVDLRETRVAPGVVAAFDADDLGIPDLDFPPRVEAPAEMMRPVLARGRVRHVGEAYALVIAEDRYRAEDAAELCKPRIEPLEPVVDAARAGSDTPLFDGVGNLAFVRTVGTPVDDVLESAPVVAETELVVGRVVHTSMEGRAILVLPRADGGLDVWCPTQTPHRLAAALARILSLAPDRVRLRVPSVGGAFGGKSQTYPEYVAVAKAALELGRPVRWTEDRNEAFTSASHGRGQVQRVRIASDHDGRVLALDVRITTDLGAYPHNGGAVPRMTVWVISGCYAIPRLFAQASGVVTNKVPTASYRGAGRPEAAHAIERAMDVLAARLDLDPAELRRRNFIRPDAFPYRSPTGAQYDSGDYAKTLSVALEAVGYDELREEQRLRRERDHDVALGIGISSYIERSGGQTGSTEWGRIELLEGGRVRAVSPTASQGQGHLTTFAQIVASLFEVSFDRVDVVQGDSAAIAKGTGTFGSRSMQVGGSALYQAGSKVLEGARGIAAETLGVEPKDLSYEGGRFRSGDHDVSLTDIVARHGPITHELEFSAPQAFPFGTHVAVVEVDRVTGSVTVMKLVLVDDCGEILNPLLAKGQAIGAAVQGLGQALYERFDYGPDGTPLMGSLIDYTIPTLSVVPRIETHHTVTPNPNVPLGTKGAGEHGCIGVPPAVANAVADALEHRTQELLNLPLQPERVWRAARLVRPR